jgi:hypothetical protein
MTEEGVFPLDNKVQKYRTITQYNYEKVELRKG